MSSTKSRKPKNRFTLCCFCIGPSNSEADLSVQLDAERCDYVVEKLAIKKVPIALFATDEDLAEMRTNNLLDKYNKYEKSPPKEAEALISSYYAMIKNNEEGISNKNMGIPKIPKERFTNTVPEALKKRDDMQHVAINTDKNIIEETCEKMLKTCYNHIVKVDIHDEPGQRIAISPELRQTLEVLGTKQPGIRVSMKQKRSDINIPPVDVNAIKVDKHYQKTPEPILKNKEEHRYHIDDIIPGQSRSIPIVRQHSNLINHMTPFNPTKKVLSSSKILQPKPKEDDTQPKTYPDCNRRITKKVPTPRKIVLPKPEGIVVEQDVQTRLTSKQLDSLINGISGDGSSKSSSQKWKIIIKERERETTTSQTTSQTSTTTSSTSSETDEDETTTD